ncbi:MAG: cell division protein CrgA [Acidimicrobiales bacterium]
MAKDKKPGRVTPTTTGRYTPPIPRTVRESPTWVPVLIGVLLAVGSALIVLNYLDVLPGGAKNAYLLVGLGLITAGFVTATQWH